MALKLIVGLGNPGDQYLGTRHNLGFSVVDDFRRKLNLGQWSLDKKFNAELVKGIDLVLARPQTYMNASGFAVAKLADYFKIAPEDIIVIHDELDLKRGLLKVRLGGAAAGHHGVESIIAKLGTDQFVRLRLGVGNWKTQSAEHGGNTINVEQYVLSPFNQSETSEVKSLHKKAIKALEVLLEKGLDAAQNQFN